VGDLGGEFVPGERRDQAEHATGNPEGDRDQVRVAERRRIRQSVQPPAGTGTNPVADRQILSYRRKLCSAGGLTREPYFETTWFPNNRRFRGCSRPLASFCWNSVDAAEA
jgi:hypothetical protein